MRGCCVNFGVIVTGDFNLFRSSDEGVYIFWDPRMKNSKSGSLQNGFLGGLYV